MYHCQETSEQNTNAVASGRLQSLITIIRTVQLKLRSELERQACWMQHAMDNGFLFWPTDIWGADVYLGP